MSDKFISPTQPHDPSCQMMLSVSFHCDCSRREYCDCSDCIPISGKRMAELLDINAKLVKDFNWMLLENSNLRDENKRLRENKKMVLLNYE